MQDPNVHKTVVMVLFNDVLMLDVTGPMEFFSISNRLLPKEKQDRLLTVSERSGLVHSSCVHKDHADLRLQDCPADVDLLLVPGGPGAYGFTHPELTAWLPVAARSAR